MALSAGVQRMVRSDKGAAGVMFTLDTESGFDQVVFVTASYGLGETVVQGAVNPDEFFVHKPMHGTWARRPDRPQDVLGSKLIKMDLRYGRQVRPDGAVTAVDVPECRPPSSFAIELTTT